MKYILSVVVLAIAALNTAAASDKASAAVEHEIAQLEKDCNDAYGANDLAKYFGYYLESATLIFDNKRTTVPDYRKMWTESTKNEPVESVQVSDMVIRTPSPGLAIASYQINVRTRHPKSATTDEKAFETDVWVRRSGAWKLTHVHYSTSMPNSNG